MKRSFDTIARPYQSLEKLCFGSALQEAREFCLPFAAGRKKALLVGDGDGRFSAALLQAEPRIEIDSIDASAKMLALAQRRAGPERHRLRPLHSDALAYSYPRAAYDFVGLHFCLDCFAQEKVDRLLPAIQAACAPGAVIAYSDFRADRWWQALVVSALYVAFRLSSGLRAGRLPRIIWPSGAKLLAERSGAGGLVISEVWTTGSARAASGC